jgi:hypothetical protein
VTLLAYIALLGWIPFVVVLFAFVPARMAAATAVIGAWLLLPPYVFVIAGLPDFSKTTAATTGMMLGALIFDPGRILSFRPRWFDLPILLFCLTGIASSLQNGLGIYDGLSDALNQSLVWGLPYLFGRLYFGDLQGLRTFAVAMVVGGLAFVLPCLWEMKMSPHLLRTFYGVSGWHGTRLGGYRPSIFFATSLELGLWMTAAAMCAWWLWRCGALKKIGQIPFGPVLLPILLVTTIFCRSTGALALLFAGMMLLWLSVRFRTRLLLAGFLLMGPLYVTVRATNLWTGQQAVDWADTIVGPVRAQSLEYRFMCENRLIVKVVQQPVFGWGGWSRSRVYFDEDKPWRKLVPTDGLWIIIVGTKGYVGLILFYVALSLPAVLFVWRFPARLWEEPRVAAGSLSAVLLGLYVIDCLLNGFPNIIYVTLAGGLVGLEPTQLRATTVKRYGNAAGQAGGATQRTPALAQDVAMTAAMRAIDLGDHNLSRGRTLKAEGRLADAEAAWRQTLDLLSSLTETHPDHSDLRGQWCECANDLAWLKLNHPDPAQRDPSLAIALARRAVETYPGDATYWNTLGAAYYRAGNFESAVTALSHTTNRDDGGTAFDDVFLAMAYTRLGNREEAEPRLARAIFRMERHYSGHPELTRLCDEARSVLSSVMSYP